jgi:predicted nucleic acid-binding protein
MIRWRPLPKRANGEAASDMQRVVIDANVLVSLLTGRNARQYEAATALLQQAEDGDVIAILPQFVVFELAYVMQSLYGVTGERLAAMIRDLVAFPGVEIADACPWRRILDIWPAILPGLAHASIVALAMANGYDAVATFDRKLANKLETCGLSAYF